MVNHILLNFINRELGIGKPTARDNYAYHCPFCHHPKPKLEIQMSENPDGINEYACWVCGIRGKSVKTLFNKLKLSPEKKQELNSIIKSTKSFEKTEKTNEIIVELPKEFKPLQNIKRNDIEARHALQYLKTRGINQYDIIKYNIGYCENGIYAGRIIFPLYDDNMDLVFFDSRTYKDNPLRYLKPPFPKNIIANEHLINWDLPIILCEGVFDMIAIKRNVIPLLGKIIQPNLMKKLLTSSTNKIYIALDSDAIKQAIEFCEMLLAEGKEVYLVEMGEEDAADMGFERFTKHIQNVKKLTYSKLLEVKLNI